MSVEKVWHLLEVMFTALLFGTQTILHVGMFYGYMSIPLLLYLAYLIMGVPFESAEIELQALLFWKMYIVGRVIALAGLIVFLIALTQFLMNRRKGVGLMRTGLYSHVRHPQFMGIIIISIGLTVMVLTQSSANPLQVPASWLMQVLGYICLARYEESHLLKRFGESFNQYKRDVPFMFPIRHPRRISETVFTILIAVLICFSLVFFPYNLIRIH